MKAAYNNIPRIIYLIFLVIFFLILFVVPLKKNTVCGKWRLLKVVNSFTGEKTEFNSENIIFIFQENQKLKIDGPSKFYFLYFSGNADLVWQGRGSKITVFGKEKNKKIILKEFIISYLSTTKLILTSDFELFYFEKIN